MTSSGEGRGPRTELPFFFLFLVFVVIPFSVAEAWQSDIFDDDDIADDFVDYKDMMNYDMSTKTMKNDATSEQESERSASPCPPCLCPIAEEDDDASNGDRGTANDNPASSSSSENHLDDVAPASSSSVNDPPSTNNDTCRAESELSVVCLSTFRKLVRVIVDAYPRVESSEEEEEEAVDFQASFRIPVDHLKVLRRVLDDGDGRGGVCGHSILAMQHLTASISGVQRRDRRGGDAAREEVEDVFISMDDLRGKAHWLYWAVSISAGFIGLWIMRRLFLTTIHVRDVFKVILLFYVVLFIVSIPWNWMALYQQAQSRQMALRTQKLPEECVSTFPPAEGEPSTRSVMQLLSSSVSSVVNSLTKPFRFAEDTDVCQKYHDAFHVDVIAEVSPMKALTITVNQLALEPLELLGHALGRFIHGAFRDLPFYLWPVALVLVMFLLLLLRGYRVGFGFGLFSLSPPSAESLRLGNSGHATLGYSENPRPSIAQDVASQLIHRLSEENLTLRQELAETRGRILLRLDVDGISSSSSSSKPLYTSPFKDPEPLAIETASGTSPTRCRTVRSNSAPELKKIHFLPSLPKSVADASSSSTSSSSSSSSSASHKLSTPSSSRRGTLVPISEEGAEDVTASSSSSLTSPEFAPGSSPLTESNEIVEAESKAGKATKVIDNGRSSPSRAGPAAPSSTPFPSSSSSTYSSSSSAMGVENRRQREVENGFVLVEGEQPENCASDSTLSIDPRERPTGSSESDVVAAEGEGGTPMDTDPPPPPTIEDRSSQTRSDLNNLPSSQEDDVADETARFCNLSIDE